MKRIGTLLLLIVCAAPLVAQPVSIGMRNELGISLSNVELANTSLGFQPADRSGEFHGKTGYGISFNRYWTDHFSTELAVQKFSANAVLGAHGIEGGNFYDAGEVNGTIFSAIAMWHFRTESRVSPYFGVGLAHIIADFDTGEDAIIYGDLNFQKQGAAVLTGGVDVWMTDRFALTGDVRVMPWTAVPEYESSMGGVDADPFITSVGAKLRF